MHWFHVCFFPENRNSNPYLPEYSYWLSKICAPTYVCEEKVLNLSHERQWAKKKGIISWGGRCKKARDRHFLPVNVKSFFFSVFYSKRKDTAAAIASFVARNKPESREARVSKVSSSTYLNDDVVWAAFYAMHAENQSIFLLETKRKLRKWRKTEGRTARLDWTHTLERGRGVIFTLFKSLENELLGAGDFSKTF